MKNQEVKIDFEKIIKEYPEMELRHGGPMIAKEYAVKCMRQSAIEAIRLAAPLFQEIILKEISNYDNGKYVNVVNPQSIIDAVEIVTKTVVGE